VPGNNYAVPRWGSPGPHRIVNSEVGSWVTVDGDVVAVLARYPALDARRPLPVIVLCHGLGGDHRGYAGLGTYLASHGYAVLHPRFLDSLSLAGASLGLDGVDERTWMRDEHARALMHTMLFDPRHWTSRVARVHAVLESLAGQRHLPVRLAAEQVIVAGHSFGAYTAQLLLGTRLFGVGLDRTFTHPAVVGGVLLSPQGSGDRGLTDRSWDALDLPLLVITATGDAGPRGEGLTWRRQPYDAAPGHPRYLAVVRGGDHLLGGIPWDDHPDDRPGDAGVRAAVAGVTAAFADRVHGDRAAGEWLASAPFSAVFEHEQAA
jgi:dienelactone hydrolase